MVTIGITRVSDTDEYRVFWKDEQGRDVEAKAYYTDDPEDAVNTLIDTIERAQASGIEVELTKTQYTKMLISKYRWLWLQNTLKKGDTELSSFEKQSPRLITPDRIITERHKAEDIIKMNRGWRKVGQQNYRGVTFWEIVK